MKRLLRSSFSAALVLTTCAVARAQGVPSRMDRYMSATAKTEHFMGEVLVAQHGRVLFRKSYGFANVQRGIRNTPAIEFELASLTKEFTAMAILQLQQRGRLSVQDPVCRFVPRCPKDWGSITIFDLLTHTSGIPDYTAFANFPKAETQPATPDGLLARLENRPLEFPPGAKFHYDNSGYVLLGYILMIAPQVRMDRAGKFHEGFGWVIQTEFGRKEVSHSGAVQGFTSRNILFPDDDALIIVLDNVALPPSEVGDVGDALAAILFHKKYAVPKE